MRPLTSSKMSRSSFALACAPLLLVPLLAACGGGAASADYAKEGPSGGSGFVPPPPPPPPPGDESASFMSVGEVISVPLMVSSDAPKPEEKARDDKQDPNWNLPIKSGTKNVKPPDDVRAAATATATAAASASAAPAGGVPGGVQGAVVDSQGGLSEAEVRATIVQRQSSFRECYDLGLQGASGGFSGTVTLRAAIGPNGSVASVDVVSSTTKNTKVDTCVADAVRRILFPSKGGGAVIAFPIAFGN